MCQSIFPAGKIQLARMSTRRDDETFALHHRIIGKRNRVRSRPETLARLRPEWDLFAERGVPALAAVQGTRHSREGGILAVSRSGHARLGRFNQRRETPIVAD